MKFINGVNDANGIFFTMNRRYDNDFFLYILIVTLTDAKS